MVETGSTASEIKFDKADFVQAIAESTKRQHCHIKLHHILDIK